ncbi:MAG: phytoene desaturase family protein [Acidimicrobiales bacterium]
MNGPTTSDGDDFDVVVIGAGHNGLVCAAYLARAGLSVCVVEARHEVGGCAGSESVLGSRVNLCNCDHSLVRTLPLIDELGLADHGLRYIDLDPGQVALGWDGPGPAPLFRSVEQTIEALAVHHPDEVDGYRRYAADAVPMARLVLELAGRAPSSGSVARTAMADGRTAARLLKWSRRSVGEVLRSYFRSDGLLGPAMAGGPAVWGLSSDTPGTGLGALAFALKHLAPVGRPVGGSGALTDSLAAAVTAGGGVIKTASRVTAILCEGERARAVSIVGPGRAGSPGEAAGTGDTGDPDATTMTASSVVGACDPRRAIVEYLRNPPPSAAKLIGRWRSRESGGGYESKIDARLSTAPVWKHSGDDRLAAVGFDDHLSPSTSVAPGLAEIDRAHRLMGDGRVGPRPMLFINVPSVLDPSVTGPGDQLLSIEVLFTPYQLRGGWEPSREPERWLEVAADLFEPGFIESIEEFRTMTPLNYERDFHMPKGHAASYAGGPVAAFLGRDAELSRYETPISGLYLTGAATFPGAGVWGAAGRNTATIVLDRLGR